MPLFFPYLSQSAGAAAAAPAFSPEDLPGLVAWYKADGTLWQESTRSTPVASDSDPVGAWDDESGNGHHLTQATSSKRLTFKTGIQNSLPVVRGDGTDDFIGKASLTVTAPFNVVMVVRLTAGNPKALFSANGYDNPGVFRHTGAAANNLSAVSLGQIHGLVTPTGARIFRVSCGATWNVWEDDGEPTATVLSSFAGASFYLNCIYGGTGGESFMADYDYCEVILHNGNLSAQEWIDTKAYLNDRWGVY